MNGERGTVNIDTIGDDNMALMSQKCQSFAVLPKKVETVTTYLPELILQRALHESVCLVHHQVGHTVQRQSPLLIEVEQSSWCGHYHIHSYIHVLTYMAYIRGLHVVLRCIRTTCQESV